MGLLLSICLGVSLRCVVFLTVRMRVCVVVFLRPSSIDASHLYGRAELQSQMHTRQSLNTHDVDFFSLYAFKVSKVTRRGPSPLEFEAAAAAVSKQQQRRAGTMRQRTPSCVCGAFTCLHVPVWGVGTGTSCVARLRLVVTLERHHQPPPPPS